MTLNTLKHSLNNVFFRFRGESVIRYWGKDGNYMNSMSFKFVNDYTLELNLKGEASPAGKDWTINSDSNPKRKHMRRNRG